MKYGDRSPSAFGLAVATIFAAPAWSAGEALEQGFLDPPAQAHPGGGIRISANADALRGQLERQKQLGIRQLSVGSEGAPGAYMSEPWKAAISSTVLAARQMGFEVTFMTSPGFSHTGDSQIQPQEAMKKLVWTETMVQGGRDFSGRLAAPPSNTGPFQNIPYFSESPWSTRSSIATSRSSPTRSRNPKGSPRSPWSRRTRALSTRQNCRRTIPGIR
jgi:hypothetical protein